MGVWYGIIISTVMARSLYDVITLFGLLFKQAMTNSLRGREYSPSRVGGSLLGMRKSAFIGCRFALGGSPTAISIAVIPSDQMSAWINKVVCVCVCVCVCVYGIIFEASLLVYIIVQQLCSLGILTTIASNMLIPTSWPGTMSKTMTLRTDPNFV